LGTSLLVIPHIEHNRQDAEIVLQEDQINTDLAKLVYTNEQGEEVQTSLNDITQFLGKWMVDTTNSIIEFKVAGSESVTDGFFKGFSGVLIVDEDYSLTYLDIEIPIAGISTFNKTRDKNIRKDDIFFDESKFPKMNYEVKNVKIEDDSFVAEGTFTMKSISLPVRTTFKLTGAGTINGKEALILEGEGELNRTKFGQTSDPSIGDDITFTFKTIFTIE
jgi:polyisoprenoid-binding protein YceI